MIINSPIEAYTLTFGFFINNRVWDLMLMTGVIYIPILLMVVKGVTDAYQGGDDEGDRGSMALRFIEIGTLKILFVYIFVLMPLGEEISISSVTYNDFVCAGEISESPNFLKSTDKAINTNQKINESGEMESANSFLSNLDINMGGASIKPPLLYALFQQYSTKATNSVASTIPCVTDVTRVSLAVSEVKMKSSDTQGFFNEFTKMCYAPLLKEAVRTRESMTAETIQEYFWMGASYFVGSNGFSSTLNDAVYRDKRITINDSYYQSLIDGIYQSSIPTDYRPENWFNIQGDEYANPTCYDTYRLLEKYIERDYVQEIEELEGDMVSQGWDLLSKLSSAYFGGDESDSDRGLNVIIKRLAVAQTSSGASDFVETKNEVTLGSFNVFDDGISLAKAAAAWVGAGSTMIDSVFIKMLAPMSIALVQCVVFALSGIIILLSNYSMKIIGSVMITIFGLEFTHVIFEMCKWLEYALLELTASDYSILNYDSEAVRGSIYNAVYYSYFMLPLIWFGMLTTVGFMASSMGAATNQQAKSSGQTGKALGGNALSGTGGKLSKGVSSAWKAGKK